MTIRNKRIPCNRVVEFRSGDTEGNGMRLQGYAAVFDAVTTIRGWEGEFDEKIVRGAFKKTLKDRSPAQIQMQYNHGRDIRVGTTPIGVYDSLREDGIGLDVGGDLFDNDVVLPVRQAIAAGAIPGMSFKFEVLRDEWRDNKGKLIKPEELGDLLWNPGTRGPIVRSVKEVKLFEAGPVSSPAYPQTSVGVRSADDDSEERGEVVSREDIIAQYQRTMLVEDDESRDDDDDHADDESIRSWLDAETEFRTATEWLTAETEWRQAVREWLDAETANLKAGSDAAPKGTSRTPADKRSAAPTGTQRKAPTPPNKKKDKAMTLEELRALVKEMTARQTEINTEFRDAELPEAEQAEFDAAGERLAEAQAAIERIEARQALIAKAAEEAGKSERGFQGAPNVHKDHKGETLDEIRKASFGDGDFVTRATDAAKHVLERSVLPANAADTSKESLEGMLRSDNEMGYVAKRMIATGSEAYERAFGHALKAGNTNVLTLEEHRVMEEARAINIGADSSSGFAVPFQLDPTLVHLGAGYTNPLRQLAKVIQLYGKEYQTLTISELTVYRALEGAIATPTEPTLAQKVARVNKVHGFVPFSMEADEDWAGMRSEIFSLLQEAKDKEEANSFLKGTGASLTSADLPEGLLTGATATVNLGTATKIVPADLYALMEALPEEFETNAVFLGNKAIYNKLRQFDNTTAGSNSSNIWGGGLEAGAPSRLLDTPTYKISGMDNTVASTKKVLVYGDIRKAFTILDRVGMAVELIPMLFAAAGAAAFPVNTPTVPLPTGQRGFYAHWRNTSKVVNPNAVRVLKGA